MGAAQSDKGSSVGFRSLFGGGGALLELKKRGELESFAAAEETVGFRAAGVRAGTGIKGALSPRVAFYFPYPLFETIFVDNLHISNRVDRNRYLGLASEDFRTWIQGKTRSRITSEIISRFV